MLIFGKTIIVMKTYFLFFLLFFSISGGFSQEKGTDFPENATGIYKGTLVIDSARGTQEIPMEFHMKSTDSLHKFTYVLSYNNSPRNYTLIVKNKAKGIYEVDENNGIILPAKFSGNTLFSFFEVQGNFLSSRMEFLKDKMHFEILFTATKDKVKTGGTSEEIPEVFGFPITTIQKAVLKKVE